MKSRFLPVAAVLVALALPRPTLAAGKETATVESACDVLETMASDPLKGIPPLLMKEAQGVLIVPELIKAGFLVGGRFGRGVLLVQGPNGAWSNPIFVSLTGGSLGFQAGVQSIDVVLVFKTRNSLDQVLKGKSKLTLGADVGVAAGPVGRQAEASTDAQLKAEIYSYSRSRGLFVGVSLEGAILKMDFNANESFYQVQGGSPRDVIALPGTPVPAGEKLKGMLARSSMRPQQLDPNHGPLVPLPSPQNMEPPLLMPPSPAPTPPQYQPSGPNWKWTPNGTQPPAGQPVPVPPPVRQPG